MAMRSCVGLTYEQIWNEYKSQSYPQVTEYELLQIHKKWKALGSSVWKEKGVK